MRRTCTMLVLLSVLVAVNSASAQQVSSVLDSYQGVWAGPDCELVVTGKFWILFERIGNKMSATLEVPQVADSSVTYDTRAIVVFDTTGKQVAIRAKDLLDGDELLMDDDPGNTITLGRRTFVIEDAPQVMMIKYDGRVTRELWKDEERLGMFSANQWLTMQQVEKLAIVEPYDTPKAKKKNTGRCLQEWQLGSRVMRDGEGHAIGVEIITNQHAYVFSFRPMVYCRAARIGSNNQGTVFAQNIRLMHKPSEFTAMMAENNLQTAAEPLTIDDSLFDPKVCVYAEDAIYWSLKTREKEQIVLNGCGGEDYVYRRPTREVADKLEWFGYEEYVD